MSDVTFARRVSLPLVIAHARPSFFALKTVRWQRVLIQRRLAVLGIRPGVARRAATYWPADFPDPSLRSPLTEWTMTP